MPVPILSNDFQHSIPIGLFPFPLDPTHTLLFLILPKMAMTELLELQNQLKLLHFVFHLDLVAHEDDLVLVGLRVFWQEEQVEVDSKELFGARPRVLEQFDENVPDQRTHELYLGVSQERRRVDHVLSPCLGYLHEQLLLPSEPLLLHMGQLVSLQRLIEIAQRQLQKRLEVVQVTQLARLVHGVLVPLEPLVVIELERLLDVAKLPRIQQVGDDRSARSALAVVAVHSHHVLLAFCHISQEYLPKRTPLSHKAKTSSLSEAPGGQSRKTTPPDYWKARSRTSC